MGDTESSRNLQSAAEVSLERGVRYGPNAWLITGDLLKLVHLGYVHQAGFTSPYVKIFSKLVRIMMEPEVRDHWLDIEVYAGLVVEHLRVREENERTLSG